VVRLAILLLAATIGVPAHVPARLRIASPAEDARVIGGTVRVVVVGENGDSPNVFALTLDGTPVDATGKLNGTFTSISVAPQTQTAIVVPVAPGSHELVLTPARDVDSTSPVIVRRFRVEADEGGGGGIAFVLAAVVVAVGVGSVVAVRRRASAGAAEPPADRPAPGPDVP
jgi:hypothetical protein